MKSTQLATFALALLAACNNPAPPDRFPGFTQVTKDGDASRFYAELNSVTRNQQGKVSFKLVRVIDGGYAIQDAMTDCRSVFRADDGMKYRDDGTSDSRYSGDGGAVDFKQQAGLNALVKLVCDKAEEGRMIVGAFDDIKALEILYGPYLPEAKSALWQNIAPPKNMDILEKNDGLVRTFLSKDFTENGVEKHLQLTATKPNIPDGYDCHACAPLVGAAIFVKIGDKWRVEAHYPYLGILGHSGQPPKMSWLQVGKDKFALLTEGGDMHQGIGSAYVGVDFLNELGLKPILSFGADFEDGNYPNVSVAFGSLPAMGLSEVVITVDREGEKQQKMQAIHRFRFANDKYEEVVNNSNESTTTPKLEAIAAPSAAPTLNSLDQSVTKLLRLAGGSNESQISEAVSAIEALPKPVKGDRKGARELNEKALQLLRSSDLVGAISALRQAVVADPSDQEVINNLAYAYLQAEKFAEAERELGNTLLLAPRRSSAWANLGYLYAKTNDIPTAVSAFQHAYRFSSNQKKTIEFLRKQEGDQDSKVREAAQLTVAALNAQEKR